jgi:hypothetical protein
VKWKLFPLALGAVLMITPCAQAGVLIWTDKDEYLPGEPVTVTIENNLASEIIMYCDLPWRILFVPEDEWIAPCACLTWIISLGPGESRTDTVDQLNCETGEKEAWLVGPYSVVLEYQIGSDPDTRTTITDDFCVGGGCAATHLNDPKLLSTWGRVKSAYR